MTSCEAYTCQLFGSTLVPVLTDWGPKTHICVSKISHHWFRLWILAWSTPSHHLNQYLYIVYLTHGIKFQWNLNVNWNLFIPENTFENVYEIAAILSRLQRVNKLLPEPMPICQYTISSAERRRLCFHPCWFLNLFACFSINNIVGKRKNFISWNLQDRPDIEHGIFCNILERLLQAW